MTSFTPPLAIGTTDKHWIVAVRAYLLWQGEQDSIDVDTLNTSLNALDSLITGFPEPSWEKFRIRIATVLPAKANDLLSQVPQKPFIHIVETLLIRDNNEAILKEYYKHRDSFKELAFAHRDVPQKLHNGKITTVGYEFAKYFVNTSKILDDLVISRRYVETIAIDDNLEDLNVGFSMDQMSFMARELKLFDVNFFSSSNQNWFAESAKELAHLSKGIIRYIHTMIAQNQAKVDNVLLTESEGSADAVIAYKTAQFAIDINAYTGLFTQMHNSFVGVIKMIRSMELFPDSIKSGVSDADKKIIEITVLPAFKRIFDGERKREVFDQIFFEGAEIENMIFRLSQELNNEYRDSTRPVCCVGFTEGAIVFLGKILPMLNFPLYLVTDKISFYGESTSGDTNKRIDIQFDNTKYDGNRVVVFDDMLNQGITIKNFIEQAREKTKALDFKICMLFEKPNQDNVYGKVDFLGDILPNVWVVGYGFDKQFLHRNANAVGSVKDGLKN